MSWVLERGFVSADPAGLRKFAGLWRVFAAFRSRGGFKGGLHHPVPDLDAEERVYPGVVGR
jgi:hypothetical protein